MNKKGHWGYSSTGKVTFLARYENFVGACGPTEHDKKLKTYDFQWWCRKGTEGGHCLFNSHPENCMRDRILNESHGLSYSGIRNDNAVCGDSFALMILGRSRE